MTVVSVRVWTSWIKELKTFYYYYEVDLPCADRLGRRMVRKIRGPLNSRCFSNPAYYTEGGLPDTNYIKIGGNLAYTSRLCRIFKFALIYICWVSNLQLASRNENLCSVPTNQFHWQLTSQRPILNGTECSIMRKLARRGERQWPYNTSESCGLMMFGSLWNGPKAGGYDHNNGFMYMRARVQKWLSC